MDSHPNLPGPWLPGTCDEGEDGIQIEFSREMSWFVVDAPFVGPDEVLVVYLTKTGNKKKMMVEKSLDNLSAADVKKHWDLVEPAIRKEVASFHEMQTFETADRRKALNICSSRWVLKFKLVNGIRTVKARLTVRGFQDMTVAGETYAGTATRGKE